MKRELLLAVGVVASWACRPDKPSPAPSNEVVVERAARPGGVAVPCRITESTILTGQGIGALTIGLAVAEVRRRCGIVQDTIVLGEEAEEERHLLVDLQHDTVTATIVDDVVWRIEVNGPAIRTADSLGVGSTLRDLLRSSGAHGAEGGAGLFVLAPSHCGLSFHLDYEVKDDEHKENWSLADLERLPNSSRVDYVLVSGCQS